MIHLGTTYDWKAGRTADGHDVGGWGPNFRGLPTKEKCAEKCTLNRDCQAIVFAEADGKSWGSFTRQGDCWLKGHHTNPNKKKSHMTYGRKKEDVAHSL